MEERKIKKSALLPVFLGIREDEVEGGHEEDVGADEDEEREVVAGAERVGEQNQDEQATDDREEDGKKQNTPEKVRIIIRDISTIKWDSLKFASCLAV